MLLVGTFIGPSPIHGIGLFAAEPIARGTRVWQFTPGFDLEMDPGALEALPGVARAALLHYGYLDPRLGRYILACDDARFMNHSDRPNTASDYSFDRYGVDLAVRDIDAGEELTIDYREVEGMRPSTREPPAPALP